MALAPFFDRARQSAAQVLRDFDVDAFERRLNEVTVTIAFDSESGSPEGGAALDLAARLIARLYPRVRILQLVATDGVAEALSNTMRSINPDIEIVEGEVSGRQIAVVLGSTRLDAGTTIYMGSDRWLARVSTTEPVGSGNSDNPFGAGAAACIALANVFRSVFGDMMAHSELDADVRLSLLNFESGSRAKNADLPAGLDLGVVQLVGVGAIGNAFVWAATRLKAITGDLHLIDHEDVDLTNLQRYVLPGTADVGRTKVMLAAGLFEGSAITATPFVATWADYVAGIGNYRFERVAVALDTARDRIQVQSSLPHRIYNAWTQTGDLGVSRHNFENEEACLACLYLPTAVLRNEDEIVAEELGLEGIEQVQRVRGMLYFGEPVGEAFVKEIAALTKVNEGALLTLAHLPLKAFRQKAICGSLIMRAADGSSADLEVPMAFQSALAGIMLAAEVVASSGSVRSMSVATRSLINLMRPVPERITSTVLKRVTDAPKCMCQDVDYQTVFRQKYAV